MNKIILVISLNNDTRNGKLMQGSFCSLLNLINFYVESSFLSQLVPTRRAALYPLPHHAANMYAHPRRFSSLYPHSLIPIPVPGILLSLFSTVPSLSQDSRCIPGIHLTSKMATGCRQTHRHVSNNSKDRIG